MAWFRHQAVEQADETGSGQQAVESIITQLQVFASYYKAILATAFRYVNSRNKR
jgi:hypothetical protein